MTWVRSVTRLFLQSRRKVRDHRDRLADLLCNPVEKKFLAVGRNLVEDLRSGPTTDKFLSSAELQCAACSCYGDREKIVRRVHIINFFAIFAPLGLDSSVSGDLPLSLAAAEGHHIHLRRAGFV